MENKTENLLEKVVSLCKRRGFIFPGSEIYGGLANSWDYGPLGVELKNNIKQLWWKKFVQSRDDMVGIDAALIMNPKVWEASGHLTEFNDPLIECKNCHERFRYDNLVVDYLTKSGKPHVGQVDIKNVPCPNCDKKQWTEVKQFNTMFKTNLGPVSDEKSAVYLRPETAQAMFVQFKNVLNTTRKNLPFGIAQIGKAFRNEITPGNFIFRTREFDLMEFEYFISPKDDWNKYFEYWLEQMKEWLKDLGVTKNVEFVEIPDGERAHYSKRTVDIEYKYPFGQKELYGLAYRTDFDLKKHQEKSGQSLEYIDPQTGDKFLPHVIEPAFGLDRSVLVALLEAYQEEDERVVLKLPPKLAPYKAAVFPLLRNKPELVEKARDIYYKLKANTYNLGPIIWDDRGNIGKRYYSQDEIGTPTCITIDYQTLEDETVTLRDRDTTKQERINIKEIKNFLEKQLK